MRLIVSGNEFIFKAKIKGHYRKLPNGKIIFIQEHKDKRKDAKKDPESFHGKVIHSDDKSTTTMNSQGEATTWAHKPHNELNDDYIHGHLNSAFSVDEHLALRVFRDHHGLNKKEDWNDFLNAMVENEKADAEKEERNPRFKNKSEAITFLQEGGGGRKKKKGEEGNTINTAKEMHDKIKKEMGEVSTRAQAYKDSPTLKKYYDSMSENDDAHIEDHALGNMLQSHGESAIKELEATHQQVEEASKMGPTDCPKIDLLAGNVEFFGHQAETLAKLNVLDKGIIDVDMGGGKGLILPADAMNLMAQGKVKKPLIVVPGATLEQNASKIHEYTENGMNVFLISNKTINEHYEGNIEKMIEDIEDAPKNTIFMASYDVFAYQDPKAKAEGDKFARGTALSGASWDYVACDEVHNIKNINSNRFKAMQGLTRVKYKRVASGTFLSNNPLDVMGPLMFLHPHMNLNEAKFKEMYGYTESPEGVHWKKLKSLRKDLENMGMISLRRSAWIDKLPKRLENLSVVKMDKTHQAVYDAVLDDVIEQLQKEAESNPRMKKFFEDDGIESAEDLPPQALAKLNFVSAIADHPHEMALMMNEKIEQVKQARKNAGDNGEVDEETMELIEQLAKIDPNTRKAIRSLEGTVSPKAKDCWNKIEEHLKGKDNGKYIVFVQRKASANHVIDHAPEHIKKHMVYYDASKKDALNDYLNNPNGPKVLVAVDASIKEGVNMQVANGMYRYDHHWSPGNQEQSYARIWRFGQKKDTKFHMGIVDGSADVPKYARLLSKLHQNMQVISDFDDESAPAFKMGLKTIQEKRDAGILPQYQAMSDKIMDYQREENKTLSKRFAKNIDPHSKKGERKLHGGKDAQITHGIGAYHSTINPTKMVKPDDKTLDSLLGHTKDYLQRNYEDGHIHDQDNVLTPFQLAVQLYTMQRASDPGKKEITQSVLGEFLHDNMSEEDGIDEDYLHGIADIVDSHLSGGKHTPHTAIKHEEALTHVAKELGIDHKNKEGMKFALSDAKKLKEYLGSKAEIQYSGIGKVDVEGADLEKVWKKMEKDAGEKLSPKYRKFLLSAVGLTEQHHKGYNGVKHLIDEHLSNSYVSDKEEN